MLTSVSALYLLGKTITTEVCYNTCFLWIAGFLHGWGSWQPHLPSGCPARETPHSCCCCRHRNCACWDHQAPFHQEPSSVYLKLHYSHQLYISPSITQTTVEHHALSTSSIPLALPFSSPVFQLSIIITQVSRNLFNTQPPSSQTAQMEMDGVHHQLLLQSKPWTHGNNQQVLQHSTNNLFFEGTLYTTSMNKNYSMVFQSYRTHMATSKCTKNGGTEKVCGLLWWQSIFCSTRGQTDKSSSTSSETDHKRGKGLK